MQPSSAVVLQGNSATAQSLVNALKPPFRSVHPVSSIEELRSCVSRHRAEIIVIDIELVTLSDIKQLCLEFPGIKIVCTHRVADELMWLAVLEAGAADLCASTDAGAVLNAACQSALARSAAA